MNKDCFEYSNLYQYWTHHIDCMQTANNPVNFLELVFAKKSITGKESQQRWQHVWNYGSSERGP